MATAKASSGGFPAIWVSPPPPPPPGIVYLFKLGSSPPGRVWTLFTPNCLPPHHRKNKNHSSSSFSLVTLTQINAVYAQGISISGTATTTTKLPPPPPRRDKINEAGGDALSNLNERIRREHGRKREASSVMDSEEADKYIQLVKEQQQRGLQKLKGDKDGGLGFSYKVDPYSLHPGDYVVHKKVGIGRFVGIKYDLPYGSSFPIEYVFIEYADGMAKLPVKQASRFLYRFNL